MTGRARQVAIGAVAVVAISACGDSPSNDAAAEVDGTVISRDEFEALAQAVAANPELFGIEEDFATGTIAAEAGRDLLRLLVQDTATQDYLAEIGATVSEADRQAALEALGPQAANAPQLVVDLLVDSRASTATLGRVAAESGEAQAAWEAAPAELGLLCVRHILVETEEEAQEVLAELEEGADFAELAAERSIEPAAADSGGAIEATPGQPCIPLQQAQGGLDPVFVSAALQAVPGTPAGPVQTSFGWHVILARPYDEVAAAVDPVVGGRQLQEHLEGVGVEVDPRYGRWDAAAGTIVALDALEPTAPQ